MASKKMDLNKRFLYIQSGMSNFLSRTLAIEMCRRLKSGSVAIFIDVNEYEIQAIKKEVKCTIRNDIDIIACTLENWHAADMSYFKNLVENLVEDYDSNYFEHAFILHNEGNGATDKLMEPQDMETWQDYVAENLYAVVALNQAFLRAKNLKDVPKLVCNISSSLPVMPMVFETLNCSCKVARDMYFRAMANGEYNNNVDVINYSPGILESHKAYVDENNNIIDLDAMNVDEKILKAPRVKPIESTLKLINILQEMSFISGHEVDYYDTFNL